MNPILKISNLLPAVFSGERQRHTASALWLRPEVTFEAGSRTMLRAQSGSGKTSLCTFIAGVRTDYEGSVEVDGRNVASMSSAERITMRRDTVAWLPQDMKLFPSLTALENIELKNSLTHHKTTGEILEMLRMVGMEDFADRKAGILSIGQQQRVAAVRALCQPFRLLLLDEPVSHLDADANAAVARLIDREASAADAAVIITSVGNDLALPCTLTISL